MKKSGVAIMNSWLYLIELGLVFLLLAFLTPSVLQNAYAQTDYLTSEQSENSTAVLPPDSDNSTSDNISSSGNIISDNFTPDINLPTDDETTKGQSSLGGTWENITLDATGDVGSLPSLVLDSSGNPHMSYWDSTNRGLKYGVWNGISWQTRYIYKGVFLASHSLAIDSNNIPHVSYAYKDEIVFPLYLRYAYWDGSSWQMQIVDGNNTGGEISLDLDDCNNPYIAYRNSRDDYLQCAHWNYYSWKFQVVDTGDMLRCNPSLVIDSSGNPHISYHDDDTEDLKYAYLDGATWQIQTVDSNGRAGEYSSLALDDSDNPHISYSFMDRATYDSAIKYAYWDGSSWQMQIVDSEPPEREEYVAAYNGARSSLVLDSSGAPHISYYNAITEDLKFAHWGGSKWLITTVDTTGKVGMYNSLGISSTGKIYIGYYDDTQGDLKLASSFLETLTLSTGGNGTTSPSTGNYTYIHGSTVTIAATPASGWRFVNWTGDTSTVADVKAASTSITMNGDYSVTAVFTRTHWLLIGLVAGGAVIFLVVLVVLILRRRRY
jgi:hypothetical protein